MLNFIDQHIITLNSTSSIAPEDLDKDRPNMGLFSKDFIKFNFYATTKLDKEVVYREPSRHNLNSRYAYLNFVLLDDKYDMYNMFLY